MDDISRKVEQACRLLRSFGTSVPIEIAYSGGKDSDVILHLARMAGINAKPIYRCTTIDPPYTISHCIQNGVQIHRPKMSFFQMVELKGLPTRHIRWCCSELKEYKILDICVQGVRRVESIKREKNYDAKEPIICRTYSSKKNAVQVILPILNWTDEDVQCFIETYGIKCHKLYYNENGDFCVQRRLGCIGCPLKYKNGVTDFIKYPKFFRRLVASVCVWWSSHPDSMSRRKFRDPFAFIANNLFFKDYSSFQAVDNGLFGKEDWKHYLSNFFGVNLDFPY